MTNQPKTEQEQAHEFSEAYKQASLKKKNGGVLPKQVSELSNNNNGLNAAQKRYNKQGGPPTGMQSEQWTMSRKPGGMIQQPPYAFENQTNKFRPKTPLKQSIDQLRGQIQALQKLSTLGGIDPTIAFSKMPGINQMMSNFE